MAEPYLQLPLRRRDGSIRGYALIDQADANLPLHGSTIGALRWSLASKGYAARQQGPRNAPHRAKLHRVILGLSTGDGLQVDHINRDRLDCRRANLRVVTFAQNRQNLGLAVNNTSGVRGVHWHAQRGKWQAHAKLNGRDRYLGLFASLGAAEAVVVAWRREHMAYSEMDR